MKSGDIPFDPLNFDANAFDELVRSQGVLVEHYKAIKCPIGLADVNDSRSSHVDHDTCSNGYIYQFVGDITVTFSNNSAMVNLGDVGILDGSTVQVTFPRYYDSNPSQEVFVMPYDKFFVKDFNATIPDTQLFESHITGKDKMIFPIDSVEYVIDSNGKMYSPTDYTIENGQLKWVSNNRPPFDASINKGTVVSIRYKYRPFFYCSKVLHEIRLGQTSDFMTGARTTVRLPYEALLKREFYFHKESNTPTFNNSSNSSMIGPRDGIFGPR